MRPVGDDPWVIHNDHGALIHDAGRVRSARSLRDDPVSAYFFRRNPGFQEGHRMLIAVPLHWSNVMSGLASPVRALRPRPRRLATAP